MSSIADDESIIEGLQRSVYHVQEDKNKALNKKNLINRIVIVSKMNQSVEEPQKVIDHYEGFFKDVQAHPSCENFTGLLLVYPRHAIHVVESSMEMLMLFLRDLAEDEGDGVMDCSRLLLLCHDVSRLFGSWNARSLDLELANIELYEPSDTVERMIDETALQLLKLSLHLSKEPNKVKLNQALDSLRDNVPQLVPDQQLVGYLACMVESSSAMLSPAEFLTMYDRAYDIRLASDETWPMSAKMFPYN